MTIDRFEALPGREDVVGRLAGTGGGRSLILNGHVDVVPAGAAAAWPEDPWGGRVDDEGRLWGRGSCDMKGGIACGIVALRVLRDLGIRLRGDVVFQSVVDEETGGPGTARAIERGHLADAAIVLEPTDGHLQPVEGGLEWVRVVIRGRTGHSAVRYRSIHAGGRGEPVSAIEKAVDVLLRIRELERYWGVHRVHPLMPRGITTINPGVIAGGSGGGTDGMPNGMVAYSNMADYCSLGLSMKYLPDERRDDVRAMLEDELARIAAADPWLREHPLEVEWGVGGVSFPPAETPPGASVLPDGRRRVPHRHRAARDVLGVRGGVGSGLARPRRRAEHALRPRRLRPGALERGVRARRRAGRGGRRDRGGAAASGASADVVLLLRVRPRRRRYRAVLDDLQDRAGVDGVTLAAAYHAARDVFPHARGRRIRFLRGGEVHFRPDPALWRDGALLPGRR